MLIYDNFESVGDAATFAAAVAEFDDHRQLVITTQRLDYFKTFAADPAGAEPSPMVDQVAIEYLFPFELDGVIVYVERLDGDEQVEAEEQLAEVALDAGGRFAGT